LGSRPGLILADCATRVPFDAEPALVALAILVVVLVIIYLFAASSFTAATLSHFTGVDTAAVQFIALCVPALYLAAILISLRRHHVLLELAGTASSVAMGFLNFASIAAVICWPISWLVSLAGMAVERESIAWTLYGCSVPVAIYGLVNALTLRVTTYEVSLPNLAAAWHGRRVAVVCDIHVGNIFGPRFVRKIVKQLNELAPTAVFISGDMFDGAVVDIQRAVKPWASFRAPAGTYFVTGNHEEIRDRTPYLVALSGVGVTVLHNEKVVVDGLQIVGVHDAEAHRRAVFQELLHKAKIDRGQPSILLAHRPGRLDLAENAGISLQVSGHTHAGQFLPFSLLVRMIYGRFGYGHHRHGSLQVVTSSGAGTGGPPFRVGTRSEIVVIQLRAGPAVT
jgi:predicted MPP superfamily phosphohydrolase